MTSRSGDSRDLVLVTLIHNAGQADEKAYDVAGDVTTLGRASDQTICIPHRSLSRSHARIERSGGRFFVVDLQSKNGTFVNGVRVKRKELCVDDTLGLGDVTLRFRADPRVGQRPQSAEVARARAAAAEEEPTGSEVCPTLVREITRLSIEDLLRESGPETVQRGAQDKLRILLEVSKLLSVSEGIDAVLRKILDLVFQILDVDRAAILLVDEKTRRLEPKVVKVLEDAAEGPIYSQNIVDYVAKRSIAALFSDAAADPRLRASQSVVFQSIRASMCVPLKPKDEVIGVLYVDNLSAANRYKEEDLDFLAAFASQAAVAIENSILYRRIEEEAMTRMQLILEAKLASLGALVAGIAHEIKNPLNLINNFAELSVDLTAELTASLAAQRDRLDPSSVSDLSDTLATLGQNVTKINEHGRRANSIIQGMLLHARGTSGTKEPADLNAVVAESLTLARGGKPTPGFEVAVDARYDASIGRVEIVGADMSRVFVNVIGNALYAMRDKWRKLGPSYAPALAIRTEDQGDRVEVRIRDNGTGVPPEIADKIYNPFFTTKPPGEGTGLGLSLSHDIVVQGHQGSLRMETAAAEFTEFIITLPKRAR